MNRTILVLITAVLTAPAAFARSSDTTAAAALNNEQPRCFASVVSNTGLAGYFNLNQVFIPGVITMGLTPSFDVRIDHYFHIGAEYMMLWAKPDTTDPARFIMNANLRLRLSVPITRNINAEVLVCGGFSIWPKDDTLSVVEPTFFEERFGWNTQPALGLRYDINRHLSLVLIAGYIANTTVLNDIVITHDMMLISFGPQIRF